MGPGQGKLDQSESDLKVPRLNCMRPSISQEHSQESIRDESNEHLGLDEIPNIYSLSFDAKVPPVCWLTELAGLGKTIRSASYSTKLASHSPPSAHSSPTARIRGFLSPLCVVTLQKNISFMPPILRRFCASKSTNCWPNRGKPPLLSHKMTTPIVIVDALDESDRGTEFLEELLHFI